MRGPYDVTHSSPALDHDDDLRALLTLAVCASPSAAASSVGAEAEAAVALLLSPYVLLSFSLRAAVLALHALVPPDAHFATRLDVLAPALLADVRVLAGSEPQERGSVHFAQARVAVILAALQLPYLGAHFAAQPFSNLIEVTAEHARSQAHVNAAAADWLPERSLGALRPLLDALHPPAGNGRVQDLSSATPFEIILHGRVLSHAAQDLDVHEFHTLHESRTRTALRILADATTQPVGLRDSRSINELLAELDFREVRYSPACLAFPALAARNPNTAIQVLARLCDLTNGPTLQGPSDATALPDLLEELAHTLEPSSLRSLDLVIRLVRDQTPATFAIPLSELSSPPGEPPILLPSQLGVLTQLVLLGPFLHRSMVRLARAYSSRIGGTRRADANRRRGGLAGTLPLASDADPDHDEEAEARLQRIEARVQDALRNLWDCTGILDARIVDGAVPTLLADAAIRRRGKSKAAEGQAAARTSELVMPYTLDPSPSIPDEVAWERELRNFCQLVKALLTSDTILASARALPLDLGATSSRLRLLPPERAAHVEAAFFHHSRSVAEALRIELRQFMLEHGRYKAANEVHKLLFDTEAQSS